MMKVKTSVILLFTFFLCSCAQESVKISQDESILSSKEFSEYAKAKSQMDLLSSTLLDRYKEFKPAMSKEENLQLLEENNLIIEGKEVVASEEVSNSRAKLREKYKEDFEQFEKLKNAMRNLRTKFKGLTPEKLDELYKLYNQKLNNN